MSLDIKTLQKKCDTRSNDIWDTSEWTLNDWLCAMAGEAGEACNWGKKLLRDKHRDKDKLRAEVGKELADVVMYACRTASHLGLDLEKLIVDKFNEVSDKKGSKIKL